MRPKVKDLALPLKLAVMSGHECRGFLKLFSYRNLTNGRKNEGLDNEKATTWNNAEQERPNRRKTSN